MVPIWSAVAIVAAGAPSAGSPSVAWIVGTDWDDTVKAGGNGKLDFGIRGVGRRVRGTYPGITTLLAELDECGTPDVQLDKRSFQVWSANPFSSKKTSSCIPNLHRKPLTRRGNLLAGLGWVAANSVPTSMPTVREWCLERTAAALGDGKFRAFRRAASACRDSGSEIVFFGDSAQGDAWAASRMLDAPGDGTRAWAFIHDMTREVRPEQAPQHLDARIAIRRPFRRSRAWESPRLNYYKTTPEAAFLLAQHGFLGRDALQRIVDATRREIVECPFIVDEQTVARLHDEGRDCCAYRELILKDAAKAEALVRHDAFWRGTSRPAHETGETTVPQRARSTEEIASPRDVRRAVGRRSQDASARAHRAATFRRAAEAEWRRRLRK